MEYERRHTVNQRRVIYLAVSGKLFSMFQVAYQSDPDTAAVLDSLRRAGLSLIVDCDDFNCDEALLQTAYNLPVGTVKVLSGKEHKVLEPAVAWLPESEGSMLHLGSFASFVERPGNHARFHAHWCAQFLRGIRSHQHPQKHSDANRTIKVSPHPLPPTAYDKGAGRSFLN